MKVLFIGGTGVISSACAGLALEQGIELYLLNRGRTDRPLPAGARLLRGDWSDPASLEQALAGHEFDAVVNWIVFRPEQAEADIRRFRGRTGQYVFISSAATYQRPAPSLPITESTPTLNPGWEYAHLKTACEQRYDAAYREHGFPVTIVRPSHTYDRTRIPIYGGYTAINRWRRGQRVIAPGDGTSLWVLTHHADFARGFNGLLGNAQAIGQAFHITSDEALTWNQIYWALARSAGVEPMMAYLPTRTIATFDPERGVGLLWDKCHSVLFDNSKIKRLVPSFVTTHTWSQGAAEMLAWYDADPARQVVDPTIDRVMDEMLAAHDELMGRASAWAA